MYVVDLFSYSPTQSPNSIQLPSLFFWDGGIAMKAKSLKFMNLRICHVMG